MSCCKAAPARPQQPHIDTAEGEPGAGKQQLGTGAAQERALKGKGSLQSEIH